jgi:large repetitive protein
VNANSRGRKVRRLRILSGRLKRLKENARFYSLPFWKRSGMLRRIARLERALSGPASPTALRTALAGAAALALAACSSGVDSGKVADNPSFAAPVKNAFGYSPVGAYPVAPAFADLDKDGDADLFAGAGGESEGVISYFKNTGTAKSPSFAAADIYPGLPDNAGVGTNRNPIPVFAPVRGGSNWDAFIGHEGSVYLSLEYYENTAGTFGTVSAPAADLPNAIYYLDPAVSVTFADLNGDGLLDAILSQTDDTPTNTISYYENTGTASLPAFTLQPSLGLAVPSGDLAFPAFVDIDADGDYDAFIGDASGKIQFYRNTGTRTAPSFAAHQANPFGLNAVPAGPTVPAFVDIDGDGDFDLFVGDVNGDIWFFENKNL